MFDTYVGCIVLAVSKINLNAYLPAPTKQRFSATRGVRKVSFWLQLALGSISSLALLLAIFSRNTTIQATKNLVIVPGVFLGIKRGSTSSIKHWIDC
uniref:DUF3611 family protein n=1 Tax=Chroococcidiopsis sp. TS-821 TaxID=1378066 RepID=UPI001AEF5D32|nr:DUF3611 family protein [Chroococcidiopsis sp. TS-821]